MFLNTTKCDRHTRQTLKAFLLYLVALFVLAGKSHSAYALSICLDPRGCEPKTKNECLRQSAGAKTEASAKALIRTCQSLPTYTKHECENFTQQWAAHLKKSGGIEWDWPHIEVKDNCRIHYSEAFRPSAWVTAKYCKENLAAISSQASKLDPATGKPLKLTEAAPVLANYMSLGDRSTVEVIRKFYYPKIGAREVAVHLGFDGPPDAHFVIEACGGFKAP